MKNTSIPKKTTIALLYILAIVIVSSIINSCKHNKQDEWLPDIIFVSENTFVYNDTTLESGSNYKIGFDAVINSFSGNKLQRVQVSVYSNGAGLILLDSSINAGSFNYELLIPLEEQKGKISYTFTVIDEKGIKNEKTINIEFYSLNPSIEFITGSEFVSESVTMQQNKFFKVGVNASVSEFTQGKLKQVIVRRKYGSLFITEIDSALSDLSSFSGEWYFTSNPLATTEEWWFLVKDEFDRVGVITFLLVTNAPQTPMNLHFTETIFNGLGENNYGWDLLNDEPLYWSSLTQNRDLVNDTAYSYLIEPFFFKLMLKSENNTKFVKANYFDFENAPYEDAVDIFTGATISNVKTYITNFSEEDIFIAKLRDMEEYIAVKITNIEQTVGDNLDRIDFEYKKLAD